jgi:acyl carrier protein
MDGINTILKNIRPESDFAGVNDFFARGMLDSFDLTLLVAALEEKYAITIEGADIVPENFRSVDAIRSLLRKYGTVS